MFKVKDIYEFQHFNSINAYVEHCDENAVDSRSRPSHSQNNSAHFNATESYADASHLIRHGWPKGVKDIQRAMDFCSEGLDVFESNSPIMDVVGPIPITGAYCSGDPECMMTPAAPELNPVINMVFDLSVNSMVEYKSLLNRGAAILALAKRLEMAGKRVAIYAASVVNYKNPMSSEKMSIKDGFLHVYIVCLKQPELDFNLHSLSYAMANVDMFRRHGFRVYEKSEKTPHNHGSGRAINLDSIEGIDKAMINIDLYFPRVSENNTYATPERATDKILEIAKESGVIK